MSRVIVNNHSDLPDHTALQYVVAVILKGKKSGAGRRYNRATYFGDIAVYVERNAKSDRFTIRRV